MDGYFIGMRRRPPARLWSILMVVALLWSQVAFALHGGCIDAATSASFTHHDAHAQASIAADHCHRQQRTPQQPVCDAHCARETGSSDVARIPPVPALLPDPCPFARIEVARARAAADESIGNAVPAARRKGPTGHPALLLLI